MNTLIELIKKRRSTRRYKPDPVPREMIEACVEAARYAPTACNTQGWRFIVVEGDLKDRLFKESLGGIVVRNKWAAAAPAVVVIAMDLDLITHRIGAAVKGTSYHLLDAGIAGEHFVLQAAELGLGTCWIGWFNKRAVKRVLQMPANWDAAAMITIGYSADTHTDKKRKSIGKIISYKGK